MEAIIPWVIRVSPALSIIGSTSIMYMILSDRQRKLKHPKNRLMLMMSSFDILSSTAFFMSNWAVGNSGSCTAMGICIWLGTAVPFYNSSLNLYYLLTIKYSMNQQRFSAQIEPVLHVISIIIPLSAAITFAARGDITPRNKYLCFTVSTSGSMTIISGIAFNFLFCVFSMSSICWSVKQQANRMEMYRFRRSTTNPSTNRSSMSTRRRLEEMETMKQAILYTSAFFITYIGTLIQVIYIIGDHDGHVFYLEVFIGLSYPLQGFWNFAIYVRPGVNRIIERDQDKSLIRALQEVIFTVRLSNANRQDDDPNEDVNISPRPVDNAQVSINTPEEINNIHITTDSAPATRRHSLVNLASILSEIDLGDT